MSRTLWSAEVSSLGGDADEMIEAGLLILFGEPVPEPLAEVSVVHTRATPLERVLQSRDQFVFADQTYVIAEVGERVHDNLTELGHAVIYVNQPGQELLPGAIKVAGPPLRTPEVGSIIAFHEA